MTRREFGISLAQAAAYRRPPNILLILADDLGWGDLGCYGNREIRTPYLDALAGQGRLFTHGYAASPVCSPSRAALWTARFPSRDRIFGHLASPQDNRRRGMPDWLPPSSVLLPAIARKAGYRTAHYGKWHLGSTPASPAPEAYGIEEHRLVTSVFGGPGPSPNIGTGEWDRSDPYFWARSSRLIADESIAAMRRHSRQPWLIQAWMLLPHAPLHPTEEQMAPYARFAPGKLPYKSARQVYYASVTDLDTQVGRMLAALDELGQAENTLVLFTSDNGPEDIHIGEAGHSGAGSTGPFRGRKRSLYEGGIRVPWLARWPGRIPAGIDRSSVISGVDLLPTLAPLAGWTLGAGAIDGEDRSAALLGKPAQRRGPLFWDWRFQIAGDIVHRSPSLAVRRDRWKLLINPDGTREELYDLSRSPGETANLAALEPKVAAGLRRELLAWSSQLPDSPRDAEAGRADWPEPGAPR